MDSAGGVSSFVRFLARKIRENEGIAIIAEPSPSHPRAIASNLRLALSSSLALLRNRSEVELIHCQQFHPQAIAVGLLGRALGKGVVMTVHGKSPRPRGLRGLLFDAVERLGAWLPHRLVFVAKSMVSGAGGRSCVIANGVPVSELQRIRSERPSLRHEFGLEGAFVIAFVGRVTEDKGIFELLAAYRRVRVSAPRPVRLLLVGPAETALESAIHDPANEGVLFLGYRTDARRFLAAADLFVLPSHHEGLSLSLLEAMAMGLPVVSTALGDTPEVVADGVTGLLVPPKDVTRLSAALRWFLEHESEAMQVGQAAMHLVESRYDESRVWREYRSLYDEVLLQIDESHDPSRQGT